MDMADLRSWPHVKLWRRSRTIRTEVMAPDDACSIGILFDEFEFSINLVPQLLRWRAFLILNKVQSLETIRTINNADAGNHND